MSAKLASLKKTTIKQLSIMAIIIIALAGIYLVLLHLKDENEQKRSQLKLQTNNLNTQIQNLQEQYKKAQASMGLYNSLQAEDEAGTGGINRQNMKGLLDKLKDTYHLSRLTLKMEPAEELPQEKFRKKTTLTEHSEVTLKFSGLTDEYLFSFIDALIHELSGYMRIENMQLRRELPINNDILLKISHGDTPALVSGEIVFHWLGLKTVGNEKDGEAK